MTGSQNTKTGSEDTPAIFTDVSDQNDAGCLQALRRAVPLPNTLLQCPEPSGQDTSVVFEPSTEYKTAGVMICEDLLI